MSSYIAHRYCITRSHEVQLQGCRMCNLSSTFIVKLKTVQHLSWFQKAVTLLCNLRFVQYST